MKRSAILILCGVCLLSDALEIIRDGRPGSTIYLPGNLTPSPLPEAADLNRMPLALQKQKILEAAVFDLNYHLKKMSGTELPVSHEEKPEGPAVVIRPGSGDSDGFTIRTEKNSIEITGVYGIYELLRRLGCDWVMPGPDGEIIPERKTIDIPDMNVTEEPDFSVRAPWYTGGAGIVGKHESALYNQWKLRQKLQILNFEQHPLMMIGGHVWDLFTRRIYKETFERKTEMLALVRQPDGTLKRQGPQLETTNPEVLELFKKYIRDMFERKGWKKDKTVCIGIGPADGWGFSESPESIAAGSGLTDPLNGLPDVTDTQILLANRLLTDLESEFKNLYLGFYLYSTHANYPLRYRPHPKIVIVIADINYSRFHGMFDPQSKTRAYYRHTMEQWGKLPNPKFLRGYNWNLAENFLPYSRLKIWGEDLPCYHKKGVIGVYTETIQSWANLAPGNYLEARLLWNSRLDWKQLLKEYCAKSFGTAAPYMEKYYLMLTERQSAVGQEAGSYFSFPLIYDRKFIIEAEGLLNQADVGAGTGAERLRVMYAGIPLALMKRYFAFFEARNRFDFATAKNRFEELKAELERIIQLDRGLVCRFSLRFLDRFHRDFVELSCRYSTGKYKMFFRIPDRLPTLFDPCNQGERMGYFNRELNDENFLKTATFSSTWDAQGLGAVRTGSVWYRVTFSAPEEKNVGILIGAADSIVRVYCNGKFVGSGQGFSKPFVFDLTDFLLQNEKNVLAIQVQRSGNSELGVGGLLYPSFIFTGPRLKKFSPKENSAVERLLPGGAVDR